MNNLHSREPGEETDELPYKRSMRRGSSSSAHQQKSSTQSSISSRSLAAKSFGSGSDENTISGAHALNLRKIGDRCPTFEITRNLLVSRRIIDLFNVGDVTGIQKIIEEAVTMDCDICILPLKQHLIGRAALIDAWESMLEAFPDGVFRVSDTTINDKGELTTRFNFSGARQFNIVLGNNSENGNENENESGAEAGEIVTSVITHNPKIEKIIVPNDVTHVNNDVSRINSDVSVTSVSTYGEPASGSKHDDTTTTEQHDSDILSEHQISSRNGSDTGILLCTKVTKKSRRCITTFCPHPLLSKSNAVSICVDYSSPLIRSSDLLEDDAAVKVYEGVIVMHTNEAYQISRVDYYWKATDK